MDGWMDGWMDGKPLLLSDMSYVNSSRFTLGHLWLCVILGFVVLRWLVLKSGRQAWPIFHAGGRCACVGKAIFDGVWSLVRGGHLKMAASPTSERLCWSRTLNTVVVKQSVLFLCVFFPPPPPWLSHALLMVTPGYIPC